MKQVASNKSSVLLKIILQNKQALQRFTKIIKKNIFTKVIKMPRLKHWLVRDQVM